MANPKPLSGAEVRKGLKALKGWAKEGDAIAKTFKFENFYQTMAFVNAVAWIAHGADHHPDMEVGYNKCKVRYSTHSVGGLSAKDFDSAHEIEQLI